MLVAHLPLGGDIITMNILCLPQAVDCGGGLVVSAAFVG